MGMASRPIVDRENPNPNLRSRTLIGLQLMEGFTYIGRNIWGKEPSTILIMARPIMQMILSGLNRLDVRGFIAIPLLGATSIWTRQAESLSSPGIILATKTPNGCKLGTRLNSLSTCSAFTLSSESSLLPQADPHSLVKSPNFTINLLQKSRKRNFI